MPSLPGAEEDRTASTVTKAASPKKENAITAALVIAQELGATPAQIGLTFTITGTGGLA